MEHLSTRDAILISAGIGLIVSYIIFIFVDSYRIHIDRKIKDDY